MRVQWIVAVALVLLWPGFPVYAGSGDEYANIRRLGVVSAIGDSLNLLNVGVMVFSNSRNSEPVSDWNIDNQISGWITQALSPRFELKKLPQYSSVFASCGDDIRDCYSKAAMTEDVDAYLIVRTTSGRDPLNTNQSLVGLGIYCHNVLLTTFTAMYAMYAIDVFDAHTGKLIDYDTAALPTGDWLGSESPWVTMEPSLWAASASEMPDAKRQEIGARMTRLVEISLPMALYHAGLAPEPHADADSVREMLLGHEPVPYFNASSQ